MKRINDRQPPQGFFQRHIEGSLSRKYSWGYLLMLLIVVLIFAVSFIGGEILAYQYEQTLDELIKLNSLFVEVETVNRAVYYYYLYLRSTSREQYVLESLIIRQALDQMLKRLDQDYSRELMDLCCMVQTYLEHSDELIRKLDAYVAAHKEMEIDSHDYIALEGTYNETQKIISYINQSFKETYSAKLVSTEEMRASMQSMREIVNLFQFAMLILAIILSVAFYKKVVDGITHSVKKLTEFATNVTHNPTEQEHIIINTNDELSVFADTFNEMLDTIQRQITQIEEDSRIRHQLQKVEMANLRISSALQSSQLKLLQSRINPHFLFNTLNMIIKTANIENAEETVHLMEATAELLRYNLGKLTKAVTMHDELENVKNYVYIQQCRFGKRIAFDFDIDPQCEPQEVPCMIVQPLVENSVTHGVGSMISGGQIIIRLFFKQGRNCLEVEDNGVGISKSKLRLLKSSFKSKESQDEHIGLKNVYLRLMLYYNDDVEFKIVSEQGKTVIHFGLPPRQKKD